LWIAVNDGNHEIVELLLARRADPNGEVDSCGTPMFQSIYRKRTEIAELLRAHGGLEHRNDRAPIERLIEQGKMDEAEKILRSNPHLLNVDDAGWGDGILAGPARAGRHDLLSLLIRLGARVPEVSKWAPYYYFKHEATAAFLLENGMDPNHMNWHRFTLLHHMAAEGEIAKAKLLLGHGAEIEPIDDEYRSTPLGVAARWGQSAMVRLLLERGADPSVAGAPWAKPLRWAELKGHAEVVGMLRLT
jgi:ankyrin repeat protein